MSINSRGFTLIEVLVSFSVVLLLTAFFPMLIKSIHSFTTETRGIHPLELAVFIHQAKMEVRTAKNVTTNGSILTIMNESNQRITYEYYQGKIRRRVNGTGHELLLHNVDRISYEHVDNGAIFFIRGTDQTDHEIRIGAIYKEWNAD